jgi:hypothetical protein
MTFRSWRSLSSWNWKLLFSNKGTTGPTKQTSLRPTELSSPSPSLPNPEKGIPTEQLKDVIIYKNENPSYHKYLNFFCIAQFALWSAMGINLMGLKDVPRDLESETKDTPFWKKINWGSDFTRRLCAGVAFLIGK